MECLLIRSIMNHTEVHRILSLQQHGFKYREGPSNQCYCYIYFVKVFDKLKNSLLIHKLDHNGIRRLTNAWIWSFLRGWHQTVVVEGAKSGYINIKSGVPQGSVLGPCLFLTYINDLPDRVTSQAQSFADNTMLSSKEEYKPWKWGATTRFYTSHTKTMLPTRKSVPRSSGQLDHTETSWWS